MPANGFSVGRDLTLIVFTSDGGALGTASLKDWSAQQITAEVKQVLITGLMLSAYLPEGWQGSASFVRADSGLDDYFANLEAEYYAGSPLPTAQITETITNPDGSISQYVYQNVALKFEGAGSWAGNKEVDQKIAWIASRRIRQG